MNFRKNKAINTVNIAVAMDEAFCFYYEDNLRMLEKCGAKLQYFSPLHDTSLPEDCDAMLAWRRLSRAVCKGTE